MEVLRILGRLLGTPEQAASPHSLGTDYSNTPIDQILDGINNDRAAQKAAAKVAWVKQEQEKAEALQKAWDRARVLESSIRAYLQTADPIITEGLSAIATRTWGEHRFSAKKRGPSWGNDGRYTGFSVDGIIPLAEISIISPQAPEPPQWGCIYTLEFHFEAHPLVDTRPDIPYHGPYYGLSLRFSDGKPVSLTADFVPIQGLSGQQLKILDSGRSLNGILSEYYRHGPTIPPTGAGD